DDEARGAADLAALAPRPDDCVVGIAASGRTPYVLGAMALARANGCLTVGITTNRPVPLAGYVDHLLDPLVGPELLTGSTRLKSGTAQKLLLNTLSTVSQIQLGKTYRNLMVDVQASNSKLRARAVRIVAAACEIDHEAAAALLARCDDEVKVAIISYNLGLAPAEARRRLAEARGHIHLALAETI
ncbi:MAG: N-acetylmuramic acid 6-phosphate etherase, partial [Anaerolineales bacterium]|nr:N-acetylmuramic acid 6-phosphate etherase [Anaerolineales bacterium]